MNRDEREMIEGLFQRLQQAEAQAGPRDGEAESLIRERMAAQPGAAYLLAQVVLVQEQGLRNLQTRVEELEREVASRPQQGGGGFLSGLFGGGQGGGGRAPTPAQTAAPAVAQPSASGWTNTRFPPQGAAGMQPGAMGGGGGGFMAGAMQTAVGVAGGMLLANAVSGLFAGEAEAAPAEAAAEPPAAAPEEPAAEPEIPEENGGFFGGGEEEEF